MSIKSSIDRKFVISISISRKLLISIFRYIKIITFWKRHHWKYWPRSSFGNSRRCRCPWSWRGSPRSGSRCRRKSMCSPAIWGTSCDRRATMWGATEATAPSSSEPLITRFNFYCDLCKARPYSAFSLTRILFFFYTRKESLYFLPARVFDGSSNTNCLSSIRWW